MTNLGYYAKTLPRIALQESVDVDIIFYGGLDKESLFITWDSPTSGQNRRPKLTITKGGEAIYRLLGPDDPTRWNEFLHDAAEAIANFEYEQLWAEIVREEPPCC